MRRVAPALALPKLHWYAARAGAPDLDRLPGAFMSKPNHGSGWLCAVRDKPGVARDELVRLAQRWLASDFSIVGRAWSYPNVRRAVFADELLRGDDGQSPIDYKLFVFGGKVRLIQVDRDRFTRHTQVLYDAQWRPVDGTVKAAPGGPLPPSASLASMIAGAEALSLGVDSVRVDLYDVAGTPYFGELTHYPNNGLSRFDPPSLDRRLGEYLRLDDYRDERPRVLYDPASAPAIAANA